MGRLRINWGFWLGLAVGLMVVVPQILLQYGIVESGESPAVVPGFITAFLMVVGIFCWHGQYVYPFMAAGVLLNGLFYAAILHAVRQRVRRP